MRRKVKNRNKVTPDFKYNSEVVSKFTNYIMERGKKNAARKIVYGMLDELKTAGKTEAPLELFENAIKNVAPLMEVRSRRIGGATYQVPREVRPERRQSLAFRWLINAAFAKKGKPMHKRLVEEIMSANKNEGEGVKKRENTHKMAEANRAFAHFAW
ncbi:MAG: 30S ribosomal protein S7 [Candidatus Paceibacterota bacterium]|jgi:small subunit ribosomal protein S7